MARGVSIRGGTTETGKSFDSCHTRWRPSKYNFLVERGGSVYVFNALRGSLLRLSSQNPKTVLSLLEGDWVSTDRELKAALGPDTVIILKRGGNIVREAFDEVEYIRLRNDATRFSSQQLSLVICPTLACNFCCAYCYQSDRKLYWQKRKMPEVVVRAVIAFVEQAVKSVRSVGIGWYGGEPTLAMDAISAITNRVKSICESANTSYSAHMITNGYELNGQIAGSLNDLRIGGIQVTLDGPREVHNSRRVHKGGRDTFDQIVSNILRLDRKVHVTIRINLDRENLESIPLLLRYLAGIGVARRGIAVTFGRVKLSSQACASRPEKCLPHDEFSFYELQLLRMARELGLRVNLRLTPTISACGASGTHCYAIDPEGHLYKCLEEVGNRRFACGRVSRSGELRVDIPNLVRWTSIDPTRSRECSECRYLPLCMGGCLYSHISCGRGDFQCAKFKYYIGERLKLYVDSIEAGVGCRNEGRG